MLVVEGAVEDSSSDGVVGKHARYERFELDVAVVQLGGYGASKLHLHCEKATDLLVVVRLWIFINLLVSLDAGFAILALLRVFCTRQPADQG